MMKIDFNNLRISACESYSELVEKLNSKLDSRGEITIDASYIEKQMKDLRSCLVTLACCYEEGNDDCRSVADDIAPVEIFNPNEL